LLERPQWQLDKNLLYSDHDSKRCSLNFHDRMPVILDPDGYDLWLDPGMTDAQVASELLKPCESRLMRSYPVSTRINRVADDEPECSAPVELAESQDRLF